MSLISEALKKARQEAARQDAAQRGHPYAVGAVEPPARRPWLPLALGLAAGTLLVLCVFAVAYFSGWGPRRDGSDEVRVAEAAPPVPAVTEPPVLIEEMPAPTPPPLPAEAVPSATEPELSPPPPAPIVIQPSSPPAEAQIQPAAPAPVETPTAQPEPAPVETPAPAAPAPPTPAEPKSYVGEVPVPGGGVLRLNGIAYSATSPVAVIDGKVVSRGEIVQGFTVVDIQVNRVRLEGHDTTVFVSLK